MEVQKILEELIAIDSQCSKSNLEIVEYIVNRLGRFEVRRFDFEKNGIPLANLVVKIPGENSSDPLCFLGHVDTVPASSKWTTKPLEPMVKQGRVYGLGASDMKAGLACMISAALNLDKKPSQDVYLLFDADEEDEGIGGRNLVNQFNLVNGRMIVAESSDGKIIYAHKGCLDVHIQLNGREGHSSLADFNYCSRYSAIHRAIVLSGKLLEYAQQIESVQDDLFGKATMNIGLINGGTGANVVAGECSIGVCRRFVPGESIKTEYERIRGIAKAVDPSANVSSTFWIPPFKGNRDGKLSIDIQRASKGLIKELSFGVKPSTTEAGLFPQYDVLVFGPGTTEVIHKPDEYVSIKDLNDFSEVYRRLMK